LFRAATAEYRRHPIELQATKAFSPASIGKSYLRAMGIRPILERQPDFDSKVLGWGMAAFFGGRAECRIRKVPLPVVYVDFLSMYPTVNALMGSWDLVVARRITTFDATSKVRRLLSEPNLYDHCFSKGFWKHLVCLVEIEPDGDILPVRAAYDQAGIDYGIGVNPYRYQDGAWYSLADVAASVLLSGKVPIIRRAIGLKASKSHQGGLKPVSIRGMVEVDPSEGDFFKRVIELRKEVEAASSYPAEEKERLGKFLKVLANSTSYGILAEFTRHELHDRVNVTVHADWDEPFSTKTLTPEDPGQFCFPPLAACITGGARLMLALLEKTVTAVGGGYVFCDTDSMGIVSDGPGRLHACPGGPHALPDGTEAVQALTTHFVDRIVEHFELLNPYDRAVVPGSILEVEDENFEHGNPTQPRRQLWCWSLSAKRYALYTMGSDGPVVARVIDSHEEIGHSDGPDLAKVSEHGLGHLLNPLDPDDPTDDWIRDAWDYMLRQELGLGPPKPKWMGRPAVTRVTASSPTVLRWFSGLNDGKLYSEQVKPGNFLLLFHPDPLDSSGILPIAPYESDASLWGSDCIDRRDGKIIQITTAAFDGSTHPRTVQVRTYAQVIARYVAHPEAKSLGPDGLPVGRRTVGLLRRRPVEATAPIKYIGKGGNRLDDRISGLVTGTSEYRTEYEDPSITQWSELVVPVLKTMDRATVAGAVGVS
jgi:hypothetical protein